MDGGTFALEVAKILATLLVAVVAALLALLANRYLDGSRARREHINGIADGLRKDIREAVEVAAQYWSDPEPDKLLNEARIKMLEQEIRAAAVMLDDCKCQKSVDFQSGLTSFLAVLTGADFEARKVAANPAHIRDVVGRGVALRKLAADLRKEQLSKI